MDIQYLLFLQNFRNSIHDAWTPFMEWVSSFATNYLILFAIFYYWYKDKKGGLYTLVSYSICMVVTPLIKLTACVYRPWIRDSRILPAGNSITTATGYSFPSGHTTTAGPLAGGMAVNLWKTNRTRWLSALFVLFIPLTAFSRNYLGVHTPQDVCVGFGVSVLSLFFTAKLFRYLDAHPEKENRLLLAGFVFCCLALVYITLKPYPMDYTAGGKLLVDPQKMMNDGYGDTGKMMGFIIARFVEKTWIRFEPVLTKRTAVAALVGAVLLFFMIESMGTPLKDLLGLHWGTFADNVITILFITALWPIVMKRTQRKERTSC